MLEMIKAIIYGIVEGITEWLPISSTGHLILVERLIPFKQTSEGFFDMFDVVIQLGAIIAVVVLFWNKIWPFYLKKNREPKKGGIVIRKRPRSGKCGTEHGCFLDVGEDRCGMHPGSRIWSVI